MDTRERRLAENESLFRSINESIQEVASSLGGETHLYEYLCECSNRDCTSRISLTLSQYGDVRANPARFVLVRGHEIPDIEHVVGELPECFVVEKEDEAKRIVEKLDPRA